MRCLLCPRSAPPVAADHGVSRLLAARGIRRARSGRASPVAHGQDGHARAPLAAARRAKVAVLGWGGAKGEGTSGAGASDGPAADVCGWGGPASDVKELLLSHVTGCAHVAIFLPFSLSLSLSLCLCPSLSLSLSLSVSLWLRLSLSLSVSLSLLSLSLSFPLSLSLSHSPTLSLSPSLPLSRAFSLPVPSEATRRNRFLGSL